MMIRLETVASSRIEHLDASARDFARALAGSRANSSATAMVAASNAIRDLIGAVSGGRTMTREAILLADAELMADDPAEGAFARKRDRAFVAPDVLAELEALEREIREAALPAGGTAEPPFG